MKKNFILILIASFSVSISAQKSPVSWEPGYLDIHFISTGSGNCALAIMPDGTSLLIDAGELNPTSARTLSPRNTRRYPNYSKLAYQWQSEYISQFVPRKEFPKLDYALVTHFHEDHYGSLYPGISKSAQGDYYLSGITGVGELVGFRYLVDRGWNYPVDLRIWVKQQAEPGSLSNYFSFVDYARKSHSLIYQPLEVGSRSQFRMLNTPALYPQFSIENVQANGVVLKAGKFYTRMPSVDAVTKENLPGENHLSAGLLFRYGAFKLYMGGDIPGTAPEFEQKPDWHDVESIVAPLVGEVDVTTANHHANRDAMTPTYLSILQPRVIVQEVWSSDHPGHEALIRLTSQQIWKGERDIFATNMLEANRLVIGELLEQSYASTNGHIVLRVMPGGSQYYLYVLNNESTQKDVKGIFGPYQSKGAQ